MAGVSPAAVALAAGEEVQNIFNDAFDVVVAGEPDYIANGDPASVSGAIAQQAGRSACRIYGAGGVDLPPRAAAKYERVCRPYLDTIAPGGAPGIAVPFDGGQCGGVQYSVTLSGLNTLGNPGTSLRQGQGPVGGVFIGPVNQFGARPIGVLFNGSPVFGGGGQANTNNANAGTWQITSISRVDGQPDGCGNPPPESIDKPDIPDTQPPPFRFNPGPNIDVDIDVQIGPGGDIIFDIGTGPITVDVDGDGGSGGGDDPGAGGDGDGPTGGDGNPGDVGSPGSPQEPGAGGEASGCAPAGSVLTGVKVDILEVPSSARQYAEGVYRGVCYAYLGVPGNLDHDPAGAMLRSGQFIFAEKNNLTCYSVRANVGFNLRVTPYYRALEVD